MARGSWGGFIFVSSAWVCVTWKIRNEFDVAPGRFGKELVPCFPESASPSVQTCEHWENPGHFLEGWPGLVQDVNCGVVHPVRIDCASVQASNSSWCHSVSPWKHAPLGKASIQRHPDVDVELHFLDSQRFSNSVTRAVGKLDHHISLVVPPVRLRKILQSEYERCTSNRYSGVNWIV